MKIQTRQRDGSTVGHFTDEHPQSSYGVLVLVPNTDARAHWPHDVYGPADLRPDEVPFVLESPATREEIARIRKAGFRLASN